jgi:hypothetical protein
MDDETDRSVNRRTGTADCVFDVSPNYLTLGALATRLDDPRVANKLQAIARQTTDERLRRMATTYLRPTTPQATDYWWISASWAGSPLAGPPV